MDPLWFSALFGRLAVAIWGSAAVATHVADLSDAWANAIQSIFALLAIVIPIVSKIRESRRVKRTKLGDPEIDRLIAFLKESGQLK